MGADGYLEELQVGFRAALAAGAARHDVTLDVAGDVLRFVFAGDEVASATLPAFAHLERAPERERALTVELWDSDASGVPLPPVPWAEDDIGPMGVVRGFESGPRRIAIDPVTRTLTVVDLDRGRAVVWAPSAAGLPPWWRASPMRFLLDMALATPTRRMVHAAAVGVEGRGVLVAGPAGAGKSTLAVSCAFAGMEYLGDDYVLLEAAPSSRAFGLFGTAKLDADTVAAIPGAPAAVTHPGDENAKSVLDLHRAPGGLPSKAVAVAAVIVPTRSGDPAGLRPISAATAVRALAPSTIFQSPGLAASALHIVAEAIRDLPAYELSTAGDVKRAPELVRRVLEETRE